VSFPLNAYLLAIVSAFLTTLLSLPLWRNWCLRVGLVDEPGQRKIHRGTIPLAGGLAVMSGLLIPTVLAALFLYCADGAGNSSIDGKAVSLLQYGLSRRAISLAGILLGALGMLVLGLLDDKYELRPRTKFLGQFLVATLVAASGVQITLFVHSTIFHYAITILWIITLINAFNFMDNMNGLCAGLAAIGAWYFGLIAAADGQYLVASIAFLAFGALLGFLPFNFPKARAFLGDAGSHLLGYILAVLAILPHLYTPRHPRRWAVLMPLLVLAVPLLDLVWVVALRWRIGQPFYQGDTNHLSHRVVRLGLSPMRAVLIIWLLSAIAGGLAFVIGL
jgi:UDP-GlcNAc:undecaprenyl-phosphate GlcNAc-1-phosphate transferase